MAGLVYAKNEYTIPRGRVFFNPIVADPEDPDAEVYSGEIYMGNCPSFTISVETEKAEHYSSETGLRQKDASVLLEVKRNGSLTCDNMSADNVALFLSGETANTLQAKDAVGADEEIDPIMIGRIYQIGQTVQNPRGARNIVISAIVKGVSTPLTAPGGAQPPDYAVDLASGRIQFFADGENALTNSDKVTITYKRPGMSWKRITSGGSGELLGGLRVISDNATGSQRDYFFPRVSLVPSGELPIIAEGTDFAQMQFDADVLKPANGEAIYVDGTPAVTDALT